jgi:hypothetical protein
VTGPVSRPGQFHSRTAASRNLDAGMALHPSLRNVGDYPFSSLDRRIGELGDSFSRPVFALGAPFGGLPFGRTASEHAFAPVFQRLFHFMQELMSDGAIDHAVIVAERDVAHGADGDGIVDHHRTLFDGT